MSRKLIANLAAMLVLLSSLGPAVAEERPESSAASDEAAAATEFRKGFGFASDQATVAQAASDKSNYPVETWGVPLSVSEGAASCLFPMHARGPAACR
jgi:hypothetical protein